MDHVFFALHAGKSVDRDGEMAVVRTNGQGKITATFADAWSPSQPFENVILGLRGNILPNHFAEKFVVVAHFAEVHRTALAARCGDAPVPFAGRAWIDTSQLAWPLVMAGLVASRSLDVVARHFGISNDAPGTAQGEAATVLSTYWQLVRRFKTALTAEDMLHSAGGEKLDSIRKLIGL